MASNVSGPAPTNKPVKQPAPEQQEHVIVTSPFSLPAAARKARFNPHSLTPGDVLQLQRMIGNHATQKLLQRADLSVDIHQTGHPETLQRTTSEEFESYLTESETPTLAKLYASWFRAWSSQFEDVDEDIRSLSNAAVLQMVLTNTAMSIMRVRQYLEALAKDQEKYHPYMANFNDWNKLKQPDLPKMTISQILEQLGEFVTYKSEHPEAIQSALKEVDKQEFLKKYENMPIFKSLIEGIDQISAHNPVERLDLLLLNLIKLGPSAFNYTMDSLSFDKFLSGGKAGDCNTLTNTFSTIAITYLGIPVEIHASGEKGFVRFIAPSKTTIDGKTGNVNNGEFWVFDNHYWIEYQGQTYDVLFGSKTPIDSSSWVARKGEGKDPEEFNNGTKLWTTGEVSNIAKRYTTTQLK